MSITIEDALAVLDDLNDKRDILSFIESNTEDDWGIIYDIDFIKYKKIKGRIVWDYGLKNELTFIEHITGKHFSLGKTKSDKKIEAVFHSLSQEYGKADQQCLDKIAIIYDSKKAKEATKKLYDYIRIKRESSCILLHIDEYKHLKKRNQIKVEKAIILGHHSLATTIITAVDGEEIEQGMSIGYDNHLCVLMVNRGVYSLGNAGKNEFGLHYQKKIKDFGTSAQELGISLEFDESKRTTTSMYNYLLAVFVEQGFLDSFFKLKNVVETRNKKDELLKELNENPACKNILLQIF